MQKAFLYMRLFNTLEKQGAYFGFASNSYCNADKARTELDWKPKFNNIHEYI